MPDNCACGKNHPDEVPHSLGNGFRPSWDEYFFTQCDLVSTRATCSRASVGCVIVKDNRILSTGYNGALAGERHCDHTKGFEITGVCRNDVITINGIDHCSNAVHAEMNAVSDCARRGISCDMATAYVNKPPCDNCFKLMKSAGITDIKVLL